MPELGQRLRDRLDQQISSWRDELVNLSRSNRLLYFRHTKTASLEITAPDALTIAEGLGTSAATAWRFFEPPAEDEPERLPRPGELEVAEKDAAGLLSALRLLERKANQEFVDKGLWTLYLGLGVLRWTDEDDKPVASPLLLVPVSFERQSTQDDFRLYRADEDVVLNPALCVKLSQTFGIELPPLEDATEARPDLVGAMVATAVDGRGWAVEDRAVLTTFTFHKEAMYRDLLDNDEVIAEHPIVRILALGTDNPDAGEFGFEIVDDSELDHIVEPEQMVTIRDADSTQRRCILAAQDGRSFVMDGPPGTGKSQTITNMIAELLHDGRTVLFVSEKAAALEVVQRRLSDAGLDEFALELHSHHTTRAAVAKELGRALNKRPRARRGFNDSDIASLKRSRSSLTSYAQAMNEVRQPLGRSLHDVLGRVSALSAAPEAPVPTLFDESLDPDKFNSLLDTAGELGRNWGPVARGDDFAWRGIRDTTMSAARKGDMARSLQRCQSRLLELEVALRGFDERTGLGWVRGLADAERAQQLQDLGCERPSIAATWLADPDLQPREAAFERLERQLDVRLTLTAQLGRTVGERSGEVDASNAKGIAAAQVGIRSMEPAVLPNRESTLEELDALISGLRAIATTADVADDAAAVAESFGLPPDELTVERIDVLAKLADLAASPTPPEPGWLTPLAQPRVDAALDVLGALVADFDQRAMALAEVFTPALLELDIRALRARFKDVHRGIRKVGGAYRADKRALAAVTVGGRVTSDVLSRLDEAVAWADLAAKLKEAEAVHAEVLGDYYAGPSADFTRIESAIDVARNALKLVGDQADPEALSKQLSRSGSPDPTLPMKRSRLAAAVAVLDALEKFLAPSVIHSLRVMPVEPLTSWANEVVSMLDLVRGAKAHVDDLAGKPVDLVDVHDTIDARAQLDEVMAELEAPGDDAELLAPLHHGPDASLEAVRYAMDWSHQVRELCGGRLRRRAATAVLDGDLGDSLREPIANWAKASASFLELFDDGRREELASDLNGSIEDAHALLERLEATLADVDEWASYASAVETLGDSRLQAVVQFCIDEASPADDVRPAIERAVLTAWCDALLASDADRLKPFGAVDRDSLVDRFTDLDRQLVASAAAAVVNACSDRRPTSIAGAAAIVQKEAQKKRKHMPVRQLLERAGAVAQELKPCFMMSPLSVSTYLPSAMRFDVVIFDEASQVRPADAINCIYRGNHLVVAGDQNQLPPTSFFTKSAGDDDDTWDEEDLEEYESVLDQCKGSGGLPSLPLQWHYRSQHEALITYSNYSFYGGGLHTFPGAIDEADDLGVALFKVDGVYRRGGARDNPVEASAVVDRILFHRHHHPTLTLGVVTFSAAQEDAVVVELERRTREHPELGELLSTDRLDGFFVKNLENVQGDERDIIIFSVGYGPDEHGKFTLQLGPLTRPEGWRRLNVAITRARRRVEVVTSVRGDDFPTEVSGPVAHLKRYLYFAERGISALALDLSESEGDAESVFEEEVIRTIQRWGFEPAPQVGCAGYRIDIAIKDPRKPGRYLLAVECDGAMYHSSKVARDRDRLRQGVLEGLGWTVHRIWGISWFRDRATQEARLRAAIDAAMNGNATPKAQAEMTPVEIEIEDHDFTGPPAWVTPYEVADLVVPSRHLEMHSPEARPQLTDLIAEVVRTEAPVHRERVMRTVREAWGVGRSGSRIRAAFDDAIARLTRRSKVTEDAAGFLWEGDREYEAVRVPVDEWGQRPLDEVCWEERCWAVAGCVEDAVQISRADLRVAAARLFGWGRTGIDITAALDEAIDELEACGNLVEANGLFQLAQ